MIANFKDCFLTITNQVEFTELPSAPRATRFKANVGIRIWRNGTNNRMLIPLIVEGETDLKRLNPYEMIKEFDQYYPYYSLSTRKELETTYGITSYDIGGLTDAIMELEEDVLAVVKRAWYKIFEDDFDNDDSSSDSRITDSHRLPFGGKTIKTEFLNKDREPITIVLQTYYSRSKLVFGEIVLGNMQFSKEIYLFVEHYNGQILFQEDEYNRPETSLFTVCNALNVDADVLLKEIHETCEKGRAAITDEEIDITNNNKLSDSWSIKNQTNFSFKKTIQNDDNKPILIEIYDYRYTDHNKMMYGRIVGLGKMYTFYETPTSFVCIANGKEVDLWEICEELKVDGSEITWEIDQLIDKAQDFLIDRYWGL